MLEGPYRKNSRTKRFMDHTIFLNEVEIIINLRRRRLSMRNLIFSCIMCITVLAISCGKQEETKQSSKQDLAEVSSEVTETRQTKKQEETEQLSEQSYTIAKIQCDVNNNLEQQPSKTTYVPFRNETVTNAAGYGIYYEQAEVNLSRQNNVLQIQYSLPPYFSWGNWLSIRREFQSVLDMSECSGIEFDLKVHEPSNASLRMTLCDVQSPEDINKHGKDEMWWFDYNDGLSNEAKNWVTVRAPFENFRRSRGAGTRHNDYELDLSKIVAYEINLISKAGKHPKGTILVRSFRTFRNK